MHKNGCWKWSIAHSHHQLSGLLLTMSQSRDRDYSGSSNTDNQITQEVPWHCLVTTRGCVLGIPKSIISTTMLKRFEVTAVKYNIINPRSTGLFSTSLLCLDWLEIDAPPHDCYPLFFFQVTGREDSNQPLLQESPFCRIMPLSFKHYTIPSVMLLPHNSFS